MKKTLLLSVVASTMIMAGGDITPVEPVVETPAAASAWEFAGQGVVYYQTIGAGTVDLFDQEGAAADAGLQLRATNNDVIGGIGAGFAVNGLSTLNLENGVVDNVMQGTGNMDWTDPLNPVLQPGDDIDDVTDGGWIAEAYLTYGFDNTSIKAGRQTLPKSLSPFAYSENWNVFANSFDAVTVVNTDITNTTIVAGWIHGANFNAYGAANNITDFNALNNDDGVYMLTVQNKSIADLTLTGTVYYGQDMSEVNATTGATDDVTILWGDAAYNAGNFGVSIQGGTVDAGLADDMTAFGAKIDGSVSGINLMAAYSSVEDGLPFQLGGTTSALYTTTITNQLFAGLTEVNSDKIVLGANMDALGGNVSAAYAMTDSDITGDTDEFNIAYTTNITDSLSLTAAYVNIDLDAAAINAEAGADIMGDDTLDVVRVIANYKF